jgi:hypothetical protein
VLSSASWTSTEKSEVRKEGAAESVMVWGM